MFKRFRNLIFVSAVGSSVVVPYVAATGRGLDSVRQFFASSSRPADPSYGAVEDPVAAAMSGVDSSVQALMPGAYGAAKEVAPPHALNEVFRFDVTIDWIMQHWPTVSMVSNDLKLQGYRVPLVTGINEDDIAGSLTYYFGPDHQVRKITFEGVTGNADRLIRDIAAPNGLVQTKTADPGLFLYQRNGWSKSESELKIRPAEIISRSNANRRFQVSMVLVPQPAGWF
jgi:hypothetical protein